MRRIQKIGVLTSAVALVLAGCATSTSEDDEDNGGGGGGTIRYAHEQEFAAYNNDQSAANAVANAVVLNGVFGFFSYLDKDGVVQSNEDYGTYEVTSDDPQTVEYTFDEDATWSDGTPVTAKDWYLFWASRNYDDFDVVSTSGVEHIEKPTEEADSTTFTTTYTQPFSDWETVLGTQNNPFLPAHVIENATDVDIVEAVRTDNEEDIAKVAEFWNNDWSGFAPGQLPDPSIIPSSGPYKIDNWQAGQSLTLVRNDDWWGTEPKNDGIVFRFIAQDAQVDALRNGDVDVIEPQPDVDLIDAIEGIADDVEYEVAPSFTYDHVDFNFDGVLGNADLREALAQCIPRQDIVDRLIKPVDPESEVFNLSNEFPFQPGYADMAAAAGGEAYEDVDLDAAREAVQRSGETDLNLRGIYLGNPNPRRQATWELINGSCSQVGFNFTIDSLTPEQFGVRATNGDFDVAQFAWSGSGLMSAVQPLYRTDSEQNYGNYSNPAMDAALERLVAATDEETRLAVLTEVETLLWDDLATVPLFAHPTLVAWAPGISGVVHNSTQTQASFNMWEWERT